MWPAVCQTRQSIRFTLRGALSFSSAQTARNHLQTVLPLPSGWEQELIRNGSIQSLEEVDQYLQYNIVFSDYAQVNDLPSVLVYEHEFRRKQHEKSKPWDQDDFHFHLRRKEHFPRVQTLPRHPKPSSEPRDAQGREICRNYNASGCDRQFCRYSHACATCRVRGHSRAVHGSGQTLKPQAPPYVSRPL